MSKDYNCQVMTDIIQVLNIIVKDTIDLMEMQLKKPQFEKFKQLEKISRLIIKNFDKPIRSNPHIIYDDDDCNYKEDSDENKSDLDGNLIIVLDSLLLIDNYLEEDFINS